MIYSPTISIVVPSYNVSRYIGTAIESVLAQTYNDWELLVTDDASTDNTCEIVERYVAKDSRIHLYRLPSNMGAGVARNNSIVEANGRYIAFLDADDWWYPEKLEKQLGFMRENGYEFTFTAFEYADSLLRVVGISRKPAYISKNMMKLGCNVGTPGVMYDTKRIGKIYMPAMRRSEDWSLWIKISEFTNGAYSLNEPLWRYRTVPNSLSRDKIDVVKSSISVYTNVIGWSKIKAITIFMLCFIPLYVVKVLRNKLDSFLYVRKKR